MSALGIAALEIARSKLGEKEATGKNDGPFVEMLQKWLDKGAGWMEHQPWCATFATWCIYQVPGGNPQIPRCGSSTSLYAWFKANGRLAAIPQPGDLGLMRAPAGSGKTHHHTFFVESVDGEFVNGVDGNWKNAVSRSRHRLDECDFGIVA